MRLLLTAFFTFFILLSPALSSAVQTDTSRVEWIKAYFNMPEDHGAALPGNISSDKWDLLGSLETLIDSVATSIDLCIYDLERPRIARALIRARQRGVQVQFITDNYNRTDAREIDEAIRSLLGDNGILSIDDDGYIYKANGTIADHSLVNSGADMHHKFAVIDVQSPSPDDDFVWTSSMNLTYTGTYNTNNSLVIKDNEVAAAYTAEFEQIGGDDDMTPEPQFVRYHKDKAYTGRNLFYVDSTRIELYFGPINRQNTKPSISKRLDEVIKQQTQHDGQNSGRMWFWIESTTI